jgi:lycopene cyclase domain-containing protein
MGEKYTYLWVDFFCIVFPFLFSFHPKLQFVKKWPFFWLPCILTASLFLIWDMLFTHWAIWNFNPRYILGIHFINLPLEELLFFICIPYACVFSYYCFTVLIPYKIYDRIVLAINGILMISLLVIACSFIFKLYTSVTFIFLALTLFITQKYKPEILSHFFMAYLFILIPFLLSNGVLTGSFIGRDVVRYHDAHNLGIRILTIPVEDCFYGMLLILLNVLGFEYLRTKERSRKKEV